MSKLKIHQGSIFKASPRTGLEMARRFFGGTSSTYDLTVHVWTVGMDWYWKKRIIDKIPIGTRGILDQGCGTGILTLRMARSFPTCRLIGVELHQEYVSLAVQKAGALRLKNVQWILGRAEDVVLKDRFDCITSSYLSKYVEMEKLIRGVKRMLREGGLLIMHDFTYPRNRLAARMLGVYFRFMQTFGMHSFPEWETTFYELEDFIRHSRWVPDLIASLERHGFHSVRVERLTLGIATIVSAEKSH